jgi:hypothetical protein
MSLKFRGLLTFAFAIVVANSALAAETKRPKNLILFVTDGLRALSVTADTAPAMAAVREVGVNFKNPHSVFPTFTTANASVMATGATLRRSALPGRLPGCALARDRLRGWACETRSAPGDRQGVGGASPPR